MIKRLALFLTNQIRFPTEFVFQPNSTVTNQLCHPSYFGMDVDSYIYIYIFEYVLSIFWVYFWVYSGYIFEYILRIFLIFQLWKCPNQRCFPRPEPAPSDGDWEGVESSQGGTGDRFVIRVARKEHQQQPSTTVNHCQQQPSTTTINGYPDFFFNSFHVYRHPIWF